MNSMLPKILYFALHGRTFRVNSPSSVDNESLYLIRGSRPSLQGKFLHTFSLFLVDILQMKQSCTTKPTSTSGIASFLVKSATKNWRLCRRGGLKSLGKDKYSCNAGIVYLNYFFYVLYLNGIFIPLTSYHLLNSFIFALSCLWINSHQLLLSS